MVSIEQDVLLPADNAHLLLQALATKLLQESAGGRRRLTAVAPLNLTDVATIRSVLATVQSSFSDPLQFGSGATNTISSAQLTAAAGGIANINTLAASSTSVTVRLLCNHRTSLTDPLRASVCSFASPLLLSLAIVFYLRG